MPARSQPPSTVAAPSPGSDTGKTADALARELRERAGNLRESSPDIANTADTMEWTVNVARRQPARVVMALAGVSVTWWVALSAFHSPIMALVCCAAILGSVAEGLFPIRYRLTSDGVRARCGWQVRAMAWTAVRSVWTGKDGVYLCPFARPSRFLRTRGVVLRFSSDNGSAVLDAVRRYWKQESAQSAHPARSAASGAEEAA